MMFANSMLVTSLFASLLFAIWSIILIEMICLNSQLQVKSLPKKIALTILRVTAFCSLTIFYKKIILQKLFQQEDDSHIWDILSSKFNKSLHTFDTRLYTCAAEFDFIGIETIYKLTATGLLPLASVNFIYLTFKIISNFLLPIFLSERRAIQYSNFYFRKIFDN